MCGTFSETLIKGKEEEGRKPLTQLSGLLRHVCMCACVHVCMCACVHVCMCAACVHVCMCVYVCTCACEHVSRGPFFFVVFFFLLHCHSITFAWPTRGPFFCFFAKSLNNLCLAHQGPFFLLQSHSITFAWPTSFFDFLFVKVT